MTYAMRQQMIRLYVAAACCLGGFGLSFAEPTWCGILGTIMLLVGFGDWLISFAFLAYLTWKGH